MDAIAGLIWIALLLYIAWGAAKIAFFFIVLAAVIWIAKCIKDGVVHLFER